MGNYLIRNSVTFKGQHRKLIMTISEQEAIFLIRATIISSKKPIDIQKLKRDFYKINGFAVPYRKFGFNNFAEFLRKYGNVFNILSRHGFIVNVVKPAEDSINLDEIFGE